MRIGVLVFVCLAGPVATATAQEPYNLAAPVRNLATLFTDLFGSRGLTVDSAATLPGEQLHTAHFNSDFQTNFGQFGTALVSQLVTVPLPSPTSGFTYEFDPSVGVFHRTTQSFGPILSERADTVGARRVSFGFATQRFTFDTVEGLDLERIPAVFTHDNAQLLGGREDVVTTVNSIDAKVTQSTTFVTAGLSDRFDVSLAVPIVLTRLTVVSDATIRRLGTIDPLTHFFRQSDGDVGSRRLFTAVGNAGGLGDIIVRFKGKVAKHDATGVAAAVDLRLPTGDELNLLGTGAVGVHPFLIMSSTFQTISPHVNVGYQWNGSSILAGNPSAGTSDDFPDQVTYAAGVDISANSRVTLSADVIGRRLIDAERLRAETFHARDGRSVFPNISFSRESFNELSGTIGVKVNLFQRLIVDGNLLYALDDHGLRDQVTPLVGFEYTF
jgi:hypothetical protein